MRRCCTVVGRDGCRIDAPRLARSLVEILWYIEKRLTPRHSRTERACHRCPSTTSVFSVRVREGDARRIDGTGGTALNFDFYPRFFVFFFYFLFEKLQNGNFPALLLFFFLSFLFAAFDVITHNRLRCVECSSFLDVVPLFHHHTTTTATTTVPPPSYRSEHQSSLVLFRWRCSGDRELRTHSLEIQNGFFFSSFPFPPTLHFSSALIFVVRETTRSLFYTGTA